MNKKLNPKQQALKDMKSQGIIYNEKYDREIKQCIPENPGFKFGIRKLK